MCSHDPADAAAGTAAATIPFQPSSNLHAGTTVLGFGKHRDQPIHAIPTAYLAWMLRSINLSGPLRSEISAVLRARRQPIGPNGKPVERGERPVGDYQTQLRSALYAALAEINEATAGAAHAIDNANHLDPKLGEASLPALWRIAAMLDRFRECLKEAKSER